jgi:hypothetical protein
LMYQSERAAKRLATLRSAGSRPYIENHKVDASIHIENDYQVIGLLVPVSSMGL